ncbi:proline iminopeptidase [Grosmannia clavigera kw1407]|uniref:Proline iminopeptidase n=1 Tax=Grosmannia clavigera (strain kw1407 / UAMH 11150) TaxID=655863 RepID=F0XNC6_GROCL|nr:proline iminopeptidase [Grosmannia clavigera kw1407]EFX00792.1 proline iminopeptidase [Grosmannia clavigera kw1407]
MSLPVPPAKIHQSSALQKNGYSVSELEFGVPLDYRQPDGEQISLTVRVIAGKQDAPGLRPAAEKAVAVYLVGGPGSDNPPTMQTDINNFYLDLGFQLLYMDYRGTGSSTPIRANQPPLQGCPADKQAGLLSLFRQDNIVRDLEAVRKTLLGPGRTWTLVGQSYGGWLAFTYLSFYPEGLREVFLTGAVPPVGVHPDVVYGHTYQSTIRACDAFYDRYPAHVASVRTIVQHIVTHGGNAIAMPNGGGATLSAERFLCLGRTLGTMDGEERADRELQRCLADIATKGSLSVATLRHIDGWLRFEDRPLYAVLHEPIYGEPGIQAGWSAWRVGRSLDQYWWLPASGELDRDPDPMQTPLARACSGADVQLAQRFRSERIYLSGEHVYPFHYSQFAALRPLRAVADLLAQKADWDPLFDAQRLRANTVPVAALAYERDMFVDAALGRQTYHATGAMRYDESRDLLHTAIKDRPDIVLPWTWSILHHVGDRAPEA